MFYKGGQRPHFRDHFRDVTQGGVNFMLRCITTEGKTDGSMDGREGYAHRTNHMTGFQTACCTGRAMKLDSALQKEREPWLCLIGGAGNPASLKEWEPWFCLTDATEKPGCVS